MVDINTKRTLRGVSVTKLNAPLCGDYKPNAPFCRGGALGVGGEVMMKVGMAMAVGGVVAV
nr:hypothetical protein [Tanacetum cinerariifolium]